MQQFMLLILPFFLHHIMLGYMNRNYFASDYFEVEADPSLPYFLGEHSQRKPSYDQILKDYFPQEEVNQASNTTCDTPNSKSKKTLNEQVSQKKTKKKRENSKPLADGLQRGHWTIEQNKRYHWFLQIYSKHFVNKHLRRMDKIFKTMEKFVMTRQAQQCRSHHQKMEKKHGGFLKILQELRFTHYGSGDVDAVMLDMKLQGVEFSEQLISWATLELGFLQKSECLESQKETILEINEVQPQPKTFLDPFQEFQCDGDQFLEGLIN